MAFIGKMQRSKKAKKPDIQVSHNNGRLGLVFSNGFMKPGTYIDVLVGSDEDAGNLKIELGTGSQVKTIGKKQKTCSWSAVRGAAKKNLENFQKAPATIVETGKDFYIITI